MALFAVNSSDKNLFADELGDVHPHKVLLVEDSIDDQKLATMVLEDSKHVTQVKVISQASELFSTLKQMIDDTPLVILLDLRLPGVDGFEVLKQLKRNEVYSNIPVIVLSDIQMPGQVSEALQLGARAYMSKPLQIEILERALQS